MQCTDTTAHQVNTNVCLVENVKAASQTEFFRFETSIMVRAVSVGSFQSDPGYFQRLRKRKGKLQNWSVFTLTIKVIYFLQSIQLNTPGTGF